jgi:hypothetical protein
MQIYGCWQHFTWCVSFLHVRIVSDGTSIRNCWPTLGLMSPADTRLQSWDATGKKTFLFHKFVGLSMFFLCATQDECWVINALLYVFVSACTTCIQVGSCIQPFGSTVLMTQAYVRVHEMIWQRLQKNHRELACLSLEHMRIKNRHAQQVHHCHQGRGNVIISKFITATKVEATSLSA